MEIKIAACLVVVVAVIGGIIYFLRGEELIPSAAPSFSVGDVWMWEITREEIDPETGWTISSDNYSEISKYMGEQNKQDRDCQVFKRLIFGIEEIHVALGQTFTVHVNVYKPENISFPPGGAKLYAGLCDPTNYKVTYNVGGWRNVKFLRWSEEERSENFSLLVTVIDPEYAPKGEDLSLNVLLELSDNSIYADSGIRLSLEAVEIENENISRHAPGILVSPGPFDMYYLIAWTDVSIPLSETPHHHYLSHYWTEGDQMFFVMSESFTYGSKIGEFVFEEPTLLAEYPLEIGKQFSYNKSFHSTYGAENTCGQDTYNMRVLRKENVTVPAGTFECWVEESTIFRTGTWQEPAQSGEFSSTTIETRWFSDSVKQAVKEISQMTGTSTIISRDQVVCTLEMVRHTEKVLIGYDVEQSPP